MDSNDEDINPSGEYAPTPCIDLTDAELHDVAVAATVANEFEAIAILDALEEAGIPAMKRGGIVPLVAGRTSEVMVPRKLLDIAKMEITKIRRQADERGVERAFDADSIEDYKSDQWRPVIQNLKLKMQFADHAQRQQILNEFVSAAIAGGVLPEEIKHHLSAARWSSDAIETAISNTEARQITPVDPEGRQRFLEDFVAQAKADGMPAAELAKHLAGVGLSHAEADAVIDNVQERQPNLIREKLEARLVAGNIIGWVGLFLFCLTIAVVINRSGTVMFPASGGFCAIVGFGIAADARSKLRSLDK